jgi:hypothetical protein
MGKIKKGPSQIVGTLIDSDNLKDAPDEIPPLREGIIDIKHLKVPHSCGVIALKLQGINPWKKAERRR